MGHSEASSQGVPAGFPLSRGSLSSPHLSSGSHSFQRDPGTGCSPPSELKLSLLPPFSAGVGSRPLLTLPSVTHRVLDELLPVVRGGSSTFRGLPRGCSRLLLPLLGLLWVLRVYQTLLSPLSPPQTVGGQKVISSECPVQPLGWFTSPSGGSRDHSPAAPPPPGPLLGPWGPPVPPPGLGSRWSLLQQVTRPSGRSGSGE